MNPLEQAVRDLSEMALLFAPDTDWNYSSYGYSALGAIIVQVTGQPFERYMQSLADTIGNDTLHTGG